MTLEVWFWFWVILSAGFIVGEVLTATFFLFPFGIGAAAAAIANGMFDASPVAQWVWFMAVAFPALMAVKMYMKVSGPKGDAPYVTDRFAGAVGIVEETVPGKGVAGMVRVNGEEWSAKTEGPAAIPAGTQVDVVRMEGAHLIVRTHRPETPVGLEGGSQ